MKNTPGSQSRFFWDVVDVFDDHDRWPRKELRIFDRHKGMGRFGENFILTCRSEDYAELVCDALNSVGPEVAHALARTPS